MKLYSQIKWYIGYCEPHLDMNNSKQAQFISRLRGGLHYGVVALRTPPMCRRCALGDIIFSQDSVEHILLYCLVFHNDRELLLRQLSVVLPQLWYTGTWVEGSDIEKLRFMLDRNIKKYPRNVREAIQIAWGHIDTFLQMLEPLIQLP